MVIAVATAVEDVSAAKYKQFDKGSKNLGNGVSTSWTAKSNGKTVKTVFNVYIEYFGVGKYKYSSMSTTLTKTSKTKLKYTITTNINGSKATKKYSEKTKLSAKNYYNKYIKKAYKKMTY